MLRITCLGLMIMALLATPAQADVWGYVPADPPAEPPVHIGVYFGNPPATNGCGRDDTCFCAFGYALTNDGRLDLDPSDREVSVPLGIKWLHVCANF